MQRCWLQDMGCVRTIFLKNMYFLRNIKVIIGSHNGYTEVTQVPFMAYYWHHSRSLRDRILNSCSGHYSKFLSWSINQWTRAVLIPCYPSKFSLIFCSVPRCQSLFSHHPPSLLSSFQEPSGGILTLLSRIPAPLKHLILAPERTASLLLISQQATNMGELGLFL